MIYKNSISLLEERSPLIMVDAWKISKLNVSRLDNKYLVRGMLVATKKKDEYIIPFGAIDFSYNIAYEKALSELVERATWIELYLYEPQRFKSTTGFSAHFDVEKGKLNSKLEVIERTTLLYLISQISEKNFEFLRNNFTVLSEIDTKILYMYIHELNAFVAYNFRLRTMQIDRCFSYGYVLGMGKSMVLNLAIDDAKMESYLVENALRNYFLNRNKESSKIMSLSEIKYFAKMFMDKNFNYGLDNLSSSNCVYTDPDKLKHLKTYDISNFCPSEFKCLDRKIFYTEKFEEGR